MNRLDRAAQHLSRRLHDVASVGIVYRRGSETVEARAILGRYVFAVQDMHGFTQRVTSRDYIVKRDALLGFNLPVAGDIIEEVDGDRTHIYEVMAPGGEQPYRWADEYRRTIRIHTKWIRTTVE